MPTSGSFYLVHMSPSHLKLKVHMVLPLIVLQINDTHISFKSLCQTLMLLHRLLIRLEIKPHLLHHHMPSFIICLVNYTAHMFNYLSPAAVLYELFTLC